MAAWGFHMAGSQVQTSNIGHLTSGAQTFIKSTLQNHERQAITQYTGSNYRVINAAITGRDPSPAPNVRTTVTNLESAFEKLGKHNTNLEPMTLVRGTKVPSGWNGTREEYLSSVFKVGARVQVGKVTSCTTSHSVASGFAGHPPYLMVIRTRDGLPVRSISAHASEDEVILAPGNDLRCVRVDTTAKIPTVYLVAEDLVAEAEFTTALAS